jgi:hypothetical protein
MYFFAWPTQFPIGSGFDINIFIAVKGGMPHSVKVFLSD